MKVYQMKSDKGNAVPNQFIIEDKNAKYFQSYNSIIVKVPANGRYKVILDEYFWNFSRTTGKYRNIFLGEASHETADKIKSGEYILKNLN